MSQIDRRIINRDSILTTYRTLLYLEHLAIRDKERPELIKAYTEARGTLADWAEGFGAAMFVYEYSDLPRYWFPEIFNTVQESHTQL